MTTYQNNPAPLTGEDFAQFENKQAKCMACGNWHDMTGLEALAEYDCQYCDSSVFFPMRISEFWLYDITGEGGMGRVYLAQEPGNPKLFAIKLSEYQDECDFRFQSLLYEGEVMLELDHPNIAVTHRFGYKEGKAFLVMDFEAGVTLEDIAMHHRVGEDLIAHWMLQLVDGLRHMADKGYLYRDLKPQNVIVNGEKLTLVDFGLAMHHDHTTDIDEDNLIGSPSYIPPERIEGQPEDIRSDIYAIGMVFYYVASRHDYFSGSPEEIINGHVHEYRYPAEELLPKYSPQFQSIIDKLIAKDPTQRYQNYDDLYKDLEPIA